MRVAILACITGLLIASTSCGGGGGGGGGGSSTGSSSSGGGGAVASFEVVRSEPVTGAQPAAIPGRIRLVLSHTIDATSVVFDASSIQSSTITIVEQAPGASGATIKPGVLSVNGAEIIYTPSTAFARTVSYGIALSSGVRDASGAPLETGAVSGPRTLALPNIVYQASFTIAAATSGGSTGGSSGGSTGGSSGGTTAGTPAALYTSFVPEANSDVWFIDFDTVGTFPSDLRGRGLSTTDATLAAWARATVIQRILSYTGQKYLRNANGTGISGTSWAISLVAVTPPGQLERDYSRHCVGGNGGNTLGESLYDPGNRDKEDNGPSNGCGIYSSGIDGRASSLHPSITTAELRFVNGTYVLGQGTATEDARFRAIQDALQDWGTAIGCVLAHEVGHSVGLDHDNQGSTSIMSAALSSQMLSNTNMAFSSVSRNLLNQNLGFTR